VAEAVALWVAFPLVGLFARRWIVLLLPAIGWPLFFLGLNRGWWGYGTGDGWQYGLALALTIGLITTALAIAAGRYLNPPFSSHRPTTLP
jgi:hypothetical protein